MDKKAITIYLSVFLLMHAAAYAQDQEKSQEELFEMEDIEFWEYFDMLEEMDLVETVDDIGDSDE